MDIDNNDFSSRIKIVALNKSIGLYNLPEASSYTLYNVTGQEVMQGTTNKSVYVIEANTLASDVYIAQIKDTNSDAVIRKKLVLQ